MSIRLKALLAFSMAVGAFAVSTAAEAGDRRFRFRFFEPHTYTYYPGLDDIYDPGYGDTYYLPPQQDDYYDPQYDEPVYVRPHKKKTAKIAPKTYATPKKSATAAPRNVTKPTRQASNAMSCDKAGKIISGYGFSGVRPASCKGQVYAFNATRGGKAYLVRLSAASGELTEVKKVQ